MSAADVAAAAGGRVMHGNAATAIGRIAIDSRTLQAGDFFVAIKGERFDGHRFVNDALARGAGGVLVHEPVEALAAATGAAGQDAPVVIQVEDTTTALQDVARDVRRRAGTRVTAITGSAGKTTTKEVAAEFLATRYRVFRNKGNLNNHIGLPLSLLELRARPEIAVVELGMNHPGEIRTLVGIAEPEVRVWTNVGDAHLGFFASPDAIADAKAEILEHARPTDVLVANANDPRVMARAGRFSGRVVTFGIDTRADVAASNVAYRGLDGTSARLATARGDSAITIPLLGAGNLANVLAAAAVALEFDMSVSQIVERAAGLKPATHRGELLRLPGGVTLIDDSYNSSPSALRQALATVGASAGCARRVAVLGEMLELGAHAIRLHEECGRAAAAAGLDLLITVGGAPAAAMAAAAMAAGMPAGKVTHVPTREDAAALALTRVRPGDLVLVKGSRGIGTDLVVDRLKAEFA
ncbi:MAG TPA: UDP-N-acetylmuramoyl-tripeptide--D-alanyl-D-alanine ligase [Vicinamibacterales bacterium]|nr:UDP-N-acetylmuramoyl-tripeptide--D-alanyl-D-alanine ligase [Vicinamibacterales bacterium]